MTTFTSIWVQGICPKLIFTFKVQRRNFDAQRKDFDGPIGAIMSHKKLHGEIAIEENKLQSFENRTQARRYEIEFTCPEFTCLCPISGFPDFATIYITYTPDKKCVELKSLKLYINSFRNRNVFHEDVTNEILNDLVELLDPWKIEVVGDFNVRGNIRTVIKSKHKKKESS